MQIRIGGGGRDVTAGVRARRHTTLLSERGALTGRMYAASFSRESQAESPACGQYYKPAQKHSVNIFSTLPRADLIRVMRPSRPQSATRICVLAESQISEFPPPIICWTRWIVFDGCQVPANPQLLLKYLGINDIPAVIR